MLKKCLICKNDFSKDYVNCPFCKKERIHNLRKNIFMSGFFILFITGSYLLAKDENSAISIEEQIQTTQNISNNSESIEYENNVQYNEEPEIATNWIYELKSDPLYGSIYYINISSNYNENDEQFLNLTLRERQNSNSKFPDYDVIFKLDQDFYCQNKKSCKIKVRIDDYIFETEALLGTQNRHDLLFVKSRGYFLDMLKNGKEMVVAVPIENLGYKSFVFDIKGLEIN